SARSPQRAGSRPENGQRWLASPAWRGEDTAPCPAAVRRAISEQHLRGTPMTPRRRNWGLKGIALGLVLLAGFYFSRGFFQRFHKTYPPTAFYTVRRADMLISIVEEGALRALNETVIRST